MTDVQGEHTQGGRTMTTRVIPTIELVTVNWAELQQRLQEAIAAIRAIRVQEEEGNE
jgi:hypothetical protein